MVSSRDEINRTTTTEIRDPSLKDQGDGVLSISDSLNSYTEVGSRKSETIFLLLNNWIPIHSIKRVITVRSQKPYTTVRD